MLPQWKLPLKLASLMSRQTHKMFSQMPHSQSEERQIKNTEQGLYCYCYRDCYCTIIVSNIFRYLTENYGKDARVTTIVDTTEVKWLHGYQFYKSDKICCTSIIITIITIITIIVIIITMISMISGAFDSVNQSRRQRGVQSS